MRNKVLIWWCRLWRTPSTLAYNLPRLWKDKYAGLHYATLVHSISNSVLYFRPTCEFFDESSDCLQVSDWSLLRSTFGIWVECSHYRFKVRDSCAQYDLANFPDGATRQDKQWDGYTPILSKESFRSSQRNWSTGLAKHSNPSIAFSYRFMYRLIYVNCNRNSKPEFE